MPPWCFPGSLMTDCNKPLVWINGKPGSSLSVFDRGLAYGDGVFETIRVSSTQPTLAKWHWQRLQKSCQTLGIPVDMPQLISEVSGFLATWPVSSGVLKVIVSRGSGGRGYNPEGCHSPSRCLSLHPLPVRNPDPAFTGARVMACKTRLGRTVLAGMKHLNRLEQVLARSEWQGNKWDEGLVCDFDGYLIEGTMSNLFVVTRDKRLVTPDLGYCGVAGVAREYILELGQSLGLTTSVEQVSPELETARELFLCNSVNGIWPVVQYGDRCWDIGDTTLKIRDCLLEELNA